MDRRYSWFVMLGLVVFSVAVGMVAYNAGVSHGLAAGSAAGVLPPGAVPYGWHRPGGFFPFGPFLFVFFWFFVLRLIFRRGFRGPWHYGSGPFDPGSRFDEWHRRAHERMDTQP